MTDNFFRLHDGRLRINCIKTVEAEATIRRSVLPDATRFLYRRFDVLNRLFFAEVIPTTEIRIVSTDGTFWGRAIYDVIGGRQRPIIELSSILFTQSDRLAKEIQTDVLLHEMTHLFIMLTADALDRGAHGRLFVEQCNRINSVCYWPKVSRRVPPEHWPMNTRTDRKYQERYSDISTAYNKIAADLKEQQHHKEAAVFSNETNTFIRPLINTEQYDLADQVRELIYNERLSAIKKKGM